MATEAVVKAVEATEVIADAAAPAVVATVETGMDWKKVALYAAGAAGVGLATFFVVKALKKRSEEKKKEVKIVENANGEIVEVSGDPEAVAEVVGK